MPFPESFLQELKLRSDITEIASSYVILSATAEIWLDCVRFTARKLRLSTFTPKTARFIALAAVPAAMSLPL